MLDSLVRVSRRVGRVTDTDTADAYTSESPITSKSNRISQHLRADTNLLTNYPLFERAFTPTYNLTLALDTYCGPTTIRIDWLREPARALALNLIASLAFRIGRSAYPREMRQTNATNLLYHGQTCALEPRYLRVS
jgi:hypothetical protein